ncbi:MULTISPECIES: hypothetical protein [Deinococcus]|uniref:hypothetical protein n=1 Tax=Deinococcus TaxID=1298 RepID=UPI000AEEF48B|nr:MULTISPECIES: hypothetical protein [Deinococcus]
MTALLITLLVTLNLGGGMALVWQLGRGEWTAALGSLLFVVAFNLLGVWLLRAAREGD